MECIEGEDERRKTEDVEVVPVGHLILIPPLFNVNREEVMMVVAL